VQFEADFLATLAEHYGAGVNVVDFMVAPEAARERINDWVAVRTERKILDLLPQGTVSAATRFVLVNAIYFNAAWANPFEASTTVGRPFVRADGTTTSVPMMRQNARLRHAAGAGFQAVELPYDGQELAMLVLLPDAGAFARFEQELDATRLTAIRQALVGRPVELGLPKFRIESGFSVKESLQQLGMALAFTPEADFFGLGVASGNAFISATCGKKPSWPSMSRAPKRRRRRQ